MFDELTTQAAAILTKEFTLPDVSVFWQSPRELSHGDAATNVALQVSKRLGRSPNEIAQVLADGLSKHADVARAEVAGAGYVNVWLTPKALLTELNRSRSAAVAKVAGKELKPVIVEYSQPNIAKPLGVHHILSTVIGQCLCNLHRHAGEPVVAWNYIGDWGTQFGKLAVAFERWGKKGKEAKDYTLDELLNLYVRFHEEAPSDPTLEAHGREAFRKLEQGDRALRTFWQDVVSVSKSSLAVIYERLHVRFDTDIGESFYEDSMQAIIDEGLKKGVFTAGEGGSLIVEFPPETGLPPYLVRKSDGATLYSTRDLAQVRFRIDTYHPQNILHVVDMAQQLYFRQLFETVKMLQWNATVLEHVSFGRMRFAEKGMSTRKGNILKLEHVLDEAVRRATEVIEEHRGTIQTEDEGALAEMMGIGALVYGILSQNRKMDITFDWEKMLSFEGNSAPYLQYTHARARSVLRKAGMNGATSIPETIAVFTDAERLLIRTLLLFPSVLEDARATSMPHKLATFLYQLCQDFNAFYTTDPILKAQEPARTLRLALTALAATVLHTGAELLTLRLPDQM
ncbi:arginine--tRNA ligase [Candidatus Peregrinibacteria bacterium]|nr:arginine--tRNA ligase [Candidatus Peregrinibacteria bacterium]